MGCRFLLQGIFLTQGSNLGLPRCRQTLYPLSHQGSPYKVSHRNKSNCNHKISTYVERKGASLVTQLIKNLPPTQETPVRFLAWEVLLEMG